MTNVISLEQIAKVENLELLARQVVEGFIIGLHKSPYHGFSVEFSEHRPYNTGENVRNIDWKVLARNDKVFVKKYEEETNLRAHIIIDASPSMYYPEAKTGRQNKISFSVLAAASLIQLLNKQRDAVALEVFSDKINFASQVKSTPVHRQMLFGVLEKLLIDKPTLGRTSITKNLHEIAEKAGRRSLIVLFSDMLESIGGEENVDDIFDAFQHLKHNKHEVMVFYMHDRKHEIEFDFDNRPHIFIDLETGEKVRMTPNDIKESYVKQMQAFNKNLKLKCAQYKIDLIEADINKGFDQILMPYLLKRNKMY